MWMPEKAIMEVLNKVETRTFEEFLKEGFPLNQEDRISRYSYKMTPWHLNIAKKIDEKKYSQIWLLQGSQTGKTTFEMAFLLWVAKRAPARMLWLQSTEDEGKTFIKFRLRPYIDSFDEKAIEKKSWKQQFFKVFNLLVKVGYASDEKSMRSLPAKYVIGDEVAVWRYSASLACKRLRTAGEDALAILATTPPQSDEHHSWVEATSGAFFRFFVPCPFCRHMQPLVFQNLKFDSSSVSAAKASVKYICTQCKEEIDHSQKQWMIENGEMVEVDQNNDYLPVLEQKNTKIAAFQISSIYSPFTSWSSLVEMFLNSKTQGADAIRVFLTDELCEAPKKMVNAHSLEAKKLVEYIDPVRCAGFVDGYTIYTAGVDVQRNGDLYVVLMGFSQGKADILDYTKLSLGDCYGIERWDALRKYILERKVNRCLIDATDGVMGGEVFDFANYYGSPFLALRDTSTAPFKAQIRFFSRSQGVTSSRQQHCLLNSSMIKDDIFSALTRDSQTQTKISFPANSSVEFFKHMASEVRVDRKRGTGKRWEKKFAQTPNHYFSAFVYAMGAMEEFRDYLISYDENVIPINRTRFKGVQI